MDEEYIYDYTKGLHAPYWMQEFRNPKTHAVIFSFQTPMQLSYFVVIALVAIIELLFIKVWVVLGHFTLSLSWLLAIYLPLRAAKLYVTYEPQGKKMHVFAIDYIRFLFEFKLNKKSIYQTGRVEKVEKIVFEKTML
ncbi:conjugal transfer protein [Pseudolactococcus insecticola]|uniref:Conjugal transfer protein n=1 Tax=Pseudolactococcus insecticola TaxID=2709158 RepID=A0A6A0B5V2_9LACT|nr:conjugal transfer protein [Lactococcus insecticola]GFH40809.1 conjugal transfer protein [Lactococcus insecticola]